MTDAEKEAREIVRAVLDACAEACGFEGSEGLALGVDQGPFADRILRFAREYGPELAREAVGQVCVIRDGADIDAFGRWLRGEELTPPLSPVEDTTPPGWTRTYPLLRFLTDGSTPLPPLSSGEDATARVAALTQRESVVERPLSGQALAHDSRPREWSPPERGKPL